MLLNHGGDVNKVDKSGKIPIMYAAMNGQCGSIGKLLNVHYRIMRTLLEYSYSTLTSLSMLFMYMIEFNCFLYFRNVIGKWSGYQLFR